MSYMAGLDVLSQDGSLARKWGRIGLVSNQASISACLEPAWKVLFENEHADLRVLFGPQHGFESTVQDNMIESAHGKHVPTGLRVYSLYSEVREPTSEMIDGLDTLVVDLQILGSRVYTYKYTMAACLRAGRKHGFKVVVLDRPNPLGGIFVEGNVLNLERRSFVGEFAIPMRHGLTVGELAQLFNAEIGCDLEVVRLKDWNPQYTWPKLGRPWIIPSPNMPCYESALTFPGTVLLEATNISEGRGTTLPFLFIGAGYLEDSQQFVQLVTKLCSGLKFDDVWLRPTQFQPSFQKWAGTPCNGLQIHVLKDCPSFPFYKLGLAIIRAAIQMGGEKFKWKEPPYEYEYRYSPIDMVIGLPHAQKIFENIDFSIEDSRWSAGTEAHLQRSQEFLIYPRKMVAI